MRAFGLCGLRLCVLCSLCVLVAAAAAACNGVGGGLFKQYEYEEEMYLSLDGSATIYVNSSIEALNALRGTSFDPRATVVDREGVARYFTTPATRVGRVTTSRRRGRQYVHVRLETDDVSSLSTTSPFAWSSYSLRRRDETVVYTQAVDGRARSHPIETDAEWAGDELVAFRIHVPSVVEYHNAGAENLRRGNIVVYEQSLNDRLLGRPIEIEVRMEPQSILYRTLILFASMFAAVGALFGLVIWRVVRAGKKRAGR